MLLLYRITITTKGKYTALEADAVEPLVELVTDPDSEVRAYALKVVFCTDVTSSVLAGFGRHGMPPPASNPAI